MAALIETSPRTDHCKGSADIEAFQQREAERIKSETLEKLPVRDRLQVERAKVAELEVKIRQEEEEALAKVNRLETLVRKRKGLEREIDFAHNLFAQCQGVGNNAEFCLSKHPNPNYAGLLGALTVVGYELAAERIVAAYPSWLAPRAAAMAEITTEIVALAKELKIDLSKLDA